MTTSIPKLARALRPGQTIVRHPDHPDQPVRYLVEAGAWDIGGEVLVDYSAPATELPGCTPNDRASGRLRLNPNQRCEIEPAPTHTPAGGNR